MCNIKIQYANENSAPSLWEQNAQKACDARERVITKFLAEGESLVPPEIFIGPRVYGFIRHEQGY